MARRTESRPRYSLEIEAPRLFSAIRLPDPVLGSRTLIVPLVRSGDGRRTRASPMDPTCWPCDRARLSDDLWALALANLAELPRHDRAAAEAARLSGRALEPWRAVLGVAHWLEYRQGEADLFERLEALSVAYQQERGEYEEGDPTRVLLRVLLGLAREAPPSDLVPLRPGVVAERMCALAQAEDLAPPDRRFITPQGVGRLLQRQRFRRGERDSRGKTWEPTRQEIEAAARASGVEEPQDAPERA
jgi:hypothetical protein